MVSNFSPLTPKSYSLNTWYQQKMIISFKQFRKKIYPANIGPSIAQNGRFPSVWIPYVKDKSFSCTSNTMAILTNGSTLWRNLYRAKPNTEEKMTKNSCSCRKVYKAKPSCFLKRSLMKYLKVIIQCKTMKSDMADHIWTEENIATNSW